MQPTLIIEPGQQYGRWTVLSRVESPPKSGQHTYWTCRCLCGTVKNVRSSLLRSGRSTSCGCDKSHLTNKPSPCIKDITNKRFGHIVALYPLWEEKRKHLRWQCKCDCGKEFATEGYSLRSGATQSCGCMRQSKGELTIELLLQSENIPFEREKTFDSCRFEDTLAKAKFDFYVDNQYLIEFDGIQHFDNNSTSYWDGRDNYNTIHLRDIYKNQWCRNNNIPLIRIPYTKLATLTIQDLKLETSNFII